MSRLDSRESAQLGLREFIISKYSVLTNVKRRYHSIALVNETVLSAPEGTRRACSSVLREPMSKVAIVGCGSQKRDLEDKQAVRIDHLYTSTYFQLKREYARTYCDSYRILSAKFGLVPPAALVAESYDLTVHDLTDDALAEWVARVDDRLAAIDADATLVVLTGQAYIDPLRDAFDDAPLDVFYPFADTNGIGEQMGWLKREIEAAE